MSGLEVVGIRASLAAAISAFGQSFVIYGSNNRDYGYIRGFALETVFFQARSVVERIRRHVIESSGDGAKEALSVKESYATSFNMIAVAGAILAQIATTALSLEYLENTHWTAIAAFVVSLVAGLLSVYYACILQQQLSSLHGPDVVKRWLTIMRKGRLHFDSRIESGHSPQESIVPSYNAALLLILPSILLNWSSIALLIGIGIYYGIVHAEKLSSVRGEHSSLAILLVYVLFTLGASLSYVLPWSQKLLESTTPAQSAPEQSSKDEPGDAPLFTTRSETADSGQTNHNGHSMRFDLLRTGGMRKAGHHDFTQDGSLGAQRNAVHVPTMRRRHSLPPHQSHGGTKSNSNNPQTRT